MACGIGKRPPLPVAVAVAAIATVSATGALASALGHVRQERKFARALHRARDLALMAPAGTGDPPRADLAALGDEATQGRDVLVVDLIDVITTVRARLTPA